LPVQGFLTKELEPGELTSALDRVMDGQILVPTILAPLAVTAPRPQGPRGLTVREAEILRRLVNGDSNRMIATHLSLSEMVVKASVKQLLRKIKAANRTQAALWAIHQGFVPFQEALALAVGQSFLPEPHSHQTGSSKSARRIITPVHEMDEDTLSHGILPIPLTNIFNVFSGKWKQKISENDAAEEDVPIDFNTNDITPDKTCEVFHGKAKNNEVKH
jgi:DNA-binding CsgD family transcriptional regulator